MTLLVRSVCVYKNVKVQYYLCTVCYAVYISPLGLSVHLAWFAVSLLACCLYGTLNESHTVY